MVLVCIPTAVHLPEVAQQLVRLRRHVCPLPSVPQSRHPFQAGDAKQIPCQRPACKPFTVLLRALQPKRHTGRPAYLRQQRVRVGARVLHILPSGSQLILTDVLALREVAQDGGPVGVSELQPVAAGESSDHGQIAR